MTLAPTIIFGATGAVGSVTARTVHQHGAKVILALRNPHKAIPGLAAEEESSGNYERIYADLTKPQSVGDAARKTGAKRAIVYMVPQTPDHMRSVAEALKSAGVAFVVFLSSFAVQGDLRQIPPTDLVAFIHGRIELAFAETLGTDGFVAVRPARFATNTLEWKKSMGEGKVDMVAPETKFDWIDPADIGRVCGALLVKGTAPESSMGESSYVNLCGPELITQRDAAGILARTMGKELEVVRLDPDQGTKRLVDNGIPEIFAAYMVKHIGKMETGELDLYKSPVWEEAARNIFTYTGKEPATFKDWIERNQGLFAA